MAQTRFLNGCLKVPLVRRQPPLYSTTAHAKARLGAHTVTLPWNSPSAPFNEAFRCFVGSQWFTANAKVAQRLLHPLPRERRLQQYLRHRVVPDECYFQTVICNDPALRVCGDTKRYARWNGGGAHPVPLTMADAVRATAAGAHFVRKLDAGAPLAIVFDRHLGLHDAAGQGVREVVLD